MVELASTRSRAFTGPSSPSRSPPHEDELRTIFASFGAVTALAGAALCYSQSDLKRLLAFATISHIGIQLLGFALIDRRALAGVAIYMLGHAAIKGGLFLAAGIVLYRAGTYDEIELASRHRLLPGIAALLLAGAAGLAGAPPFGTFWGEMMIGGAAHALRRPWTEWIVFLSGAATAGAIFRFTARAFFGWGPKAHAHRSDRRAAETAHSHTPPAMAVAAIALILIGLLAGFAPGITGAAESLAIHFQDRDAYARSVLDHLGALSAERRRPARPSRRLLSRPRHARRRPRARRRHAALPKRTPRRRTALCRRASSRRRTTA